MIAVDISLRYGPDFFFSGIPNFDRVPPGSVSSVALTHTTHSLWDLQAIMNNIQRFILSQRYGRVLDFPLQDNWEYLCYILTK